MHFPIQHPVFCLLIFIVLASGCTTDPGEEIESKKTSFNQYPTHKLVTHKDFVYAGTDSGLYRKAVDPDVVQWESLGLSNATIRTFLVFSDQEILASANFGYENDQTTIARTTDGGQQWSSFRNGYSANVNNRIPRTMDLHPQNQDILFAGGPGNIDIAKSTNKGASWELVSGTWENIGGLFFIKIDSQNQDIVWAGGTNAILRANLIKSSDGGQNWQEVPLTGAEANVNDLLIKPSNSNVLVAGLEGGFSQVIRKSRDGGQNWYTVDEGVNTRTMAHSARNPKTIYASGGNAGNNLFFVHSSDFGETWQQITVPDAPANIRVNDMVSVMVNGSEVLYFGTNKGVYSYRITE